ncbi:MAG: FAD-binding protein, partial [Cutibacterium avidum]|nr:FAD-binding protein [Cutibacterium avidum]
MNRGARSSIPSALLTDLLEMLGETKVSHDPLDLVAVAPDASHYLLTPGVLVRAGSTSDVAAAMAAAKRHNVAVNFRSGGTSLSGQGLTNGVMVDARRSFRGIEVLDGGRKVRVQPG